MYVVEYRANKGVVVVVVVVMPKLLNTAVARCLVGCIVQSH